MKKISKSKLLNNNRVKKLLFIIAFILIFLRILSYAWCSDDAFHIYTMAKNLLTGNGFTPTPGLRVNVATCPFWALIVVFGMLFWNNPYAIGMIFNLLFSGIALVMLFRQIYKKENWFFVLVFVSLILCLSRTYLSYTTSGLENALILLLSTLYLEVFFQNEFFSKKELFKIALLEGLIAFTRMDCALIFSFTSAYAFLLRYKKYKSDFSCFSWKKLFSVVPIALIGLSPFILWEIFSLFYYGSFVPNTALAKLNTGFPLGDYLIRGFWYTVEFGIYDFFLLSIIFYFIFYAAKKFSRIHRVEKIFLIASGIMLYFVYIIYIGGDFMSGRHFLALFYISLITSVKQIHTVDFKLTIGTLFLVTFLISSILFLNKQPCMVCDEREYYYQDTGLIPIITDYLKNGETTIITKNIGNGIQWFYGNKQSYESRLYDPLLSRLPATYYPDWRVGHMGRKMPKGYRETLDTGENYIEDPDLAFYYSKLRFVISGNLFSSYRIKELIKFQLGTYDSYLQRYIDKDKQENLLQF
ncbi:hypothetical protein IKR20_06850 [bacterium]|nr:hypothetical protein [bacterium]